MRGIDAEGCCDEEGSIMGCNGVDNEEDDEDEDEEEAEVSKSTAVIAT